MHAQISKQVPRKCHKVDFEKKKNCYQFVRITFKIVKRQLVSLNNYTSFTCKFHKECADFILLAVFVSFFNKNLHWHDFDFNQYDCVILREMSTQKNLIAKLT